MNRLADYLRPEEFYDVVGQQHICRVLEKQIEVGYLSNMIFYAGPGVGKTTIATILAKKLKKSFYKINASTASLDDIKDVIKETEYIQNQDGVILWIDEVHLFNKRQQQALLSYIENGSITLICSTAENPFFTLHKALVSRCLVFKFNSLSKEDLIEGLKKALLRLENKLNNKILVENEALDLIASLSGGGDMRQALNVLEAALYLKNYKVKNEVTITVNDINELSISQSFTFDTNGDIHFDLLSALQKSIRGSDVNASVYYLGRLLLGGDLQSICRRILVIASEDIGLAYPNAITIVKSCVDSALQIGLPECKIILSQAVILLASSPKSNSACKAILNVMSYLENDDTLDIPPHLKDAHYSGAYRLGHGKDYLYPHNYPNNFVKQQYLPTKIKDKVFYEYGDNKMEQTTKLYWSKIKKTPRN
ncbi:replication-associated recombination protein A [Clostridium carnis]